MTGTVRREGEVVRVVFSSRACLFVRGFQNFLYLAPIQTIMNLAPVINRSLDDRLEVLLCQVAVEIFQAEGFANQLANIFESNFLWIEEAILGNSKPFWCELRVFSLGFE